MLIYFAAMLTAAAVIWFNNRKRESNRWAAFFLCCASTGGLAALLADSRMQALSHALQFLNYTLTPYAVLIFSMVYAGSDAINRRLAQLKRWLLLPVAAMALLSWLSVNDKLFFVLLLLWCGPYYGAACYLLIASYWKERDKHVRRNRFITTIIIVPTLMAVLVFIYIAKIFSADFDFFSYVSIFIIYSLGLALLCTFVYGVLGVKLRFEDDPLESTMKAVSTGAAMLNHTIKNEIGKIAISTENLKNSLQDADDQSRQHMQIITNASNHMLTMVTRIHSQMQHIVLTEKPVRMDQLLDHCLQQHAAMLEQRQVSIRRSYLVRPVVLCDSVHVIEAISNLLMNACDAIKDGGMIEAQLLPHKRGVQLIIQDNGTGIAADKLKQVFEPFFSSGKGSRNFGLGLSYVYNVMQKSGGKVEVTSTEGEGTSVSLFWPKKKVLETFT